MQVAGLRLQSLGLLSSGLSCAGLLLVSLCSRESIWFRNGRLSEAPCVLVS